MTALTETSTLSESGPARAAAEPGLLVVFAGSVPVLHALAIGRGRVIGREIEPHVSLPDRSISRAHAEIAPVTEGFSVRDLGSHNGTFIDGVRITGEARCGAAAVLRAGGTVAVFVPDVRPFAGLRSLDHEAGVVAGPALREALDRVRRAAARAPTLLIRGETGTGKELAAAAFHSAGPQAAGPRVVVNCAAIPVSVAERLLFGAVRGAFSGATQDADGYLAAADGGSLFLDEIGELDLEVQAKLLRAIETREIVPLGATRPRPVRARIALATHRDLRAQVAAGRFRGDLLFRIAQPEVCLPPLRERREEIPALIARELSRCAPALRAHAKLVERCLIAAWPGNVRELLGAARQAAEAAMAQGDAIVRADHLELAESRAAEPAEDEGEHAPAVVDAEAIEAALRAQGGSVTAAARALGVNRTHLYRLMKRLGVRVEGDR
ncbi:two component, sigma54 specific, transcriptional regulator, Fis family protein [Minicystis rosea]|nr:two component, sigma54 specific, transcriptional regulator, Fis family protein [Minicystis rosea]